MKLRNRYRFNRLSLAVGVVLVGVLAGYIVGRQSIMHVTDSRMQQYADLIVQREDDIGDEITDILTRANASTYEACSDQDIGQLRRLTFVARFLKDVGRLEGDNFLCSATLGKLASPKAMLKPDVILPGDLRFYEAYPLHASKDVAPIVASVRSDVVVSPDVLHEFSQEPISYGVRVVDPSKEKALVASGKASWMDLSTSNSRRVQRVGDTLSLDRCSQRYPLCVTTKIHMQNVWRGTRGLLLGYIATGGTAGMSCAMVLLLAGRKRRSPTSQLKRAILLGKLSVAYQPVVELGSTRIVGAEALARWTDEDGDSIRPETIIALAEAEGFVSEITRFVLTRALQELRPVFDVDPDFQISVNLAPSDLADPRLLLLLDETLSSGTITPANVAFELPERATFDRAVAVAAIRRLRDRGHSVYIDDFGTGYSNLAYLNELSVDGIKINRTFIATIGTDSVTASIVPQILAVAEALSLKVVLQGIEREEQASYFRTDDPHMLAQGWFFGLPVPARSLLFLCAEKSE